MTRVYGIFQKFVIYVLLAIIPEIMGPVISETQAQTKYPVFLATLENSFKTGVKGLSRVQ